MKNWRDSTPYLVLMVALFIAIGAALGIGVNSWLRSL